MRVCQDVAMQSHQHQSPVANEGELSKRCNGRSDPLRPTNDKPPNNVHAKRHTRTSASHRLPRHSPPAGAPPSHGRLFLRQPVGAETSTLGPSIIHSPQRRATPLQRRGCRAFLHIRGRAMRTQKRPALRCAGRRVGDRWEQFASEGNSGAAVRQTEHLTDCCNHRRERSERRKTARGQASHCPGLSKGIFGEPSDVRGYQNGWKMIRTVG